MDRCEINNMFVSKDKSKIESRSGIIERNSLETK